LDPGHTRRGRNPPLYSFPAAEAEKGAVLSKERNPNPRGIKDEGNSQDKEHREQCLGGEGGGKASKNRGKSPSAGKKVGGVYFERGQQTRNKKVAP